MSEYDLQEIALRVRRNVHLSHGRPAKSYKRPFWDLIDRLTSLAEAFPHVGIQESIVAALNYLETEDMYNGLQDPSQMA